jgi:cyclopropane-fatty-acyl-phospholipid synthase
VNVRQTISAERLLHHADAGHFERRRGGRAERWLATALLRRVTYDQITVRGVFTGTGLTTTYGRQGELAASVVVHDTRAYSAVIREGSIGLGRGYIEGWWSSDDPVAVVRVLIRNMGPIDAMRNRLRAVTGPFADRFRRAVRRPTRAENKDDIGAHYDIGNDFFEIFLDETMTYSSAVFERPDMSLADASRHKYDVLLGKLGVTDDHHLLEIGTGWGGLAIRAAGTTGCRVTTTTISDEQLAEARRRVDRAGLDDRVTLLAEDWRDLEGVHDRLISIEMIEAVDWREYDEYFSTIERCLRPDGLAAIQAICLPDQRWDRAKNTEDFIKRFVFPNGCLPSVGAISRSIADATTMRVVEVEDFGADYARTLQLWRERFDARLADVRACGLDERFCRLWRFYLAYCEAGFRERHCTVVQIVIAGRDWRASEPVNR